MPSERGRPMGAHQPDSITERRRGGRSARFTLPGDGIEPMDLTGNPARQAGRRGDTRRDAAPGLETEDRGSASHKTPGRAM